MLSTGNDVVALNAINVTRTKQPKFYTKILTSAEAVLHNESRFVTIPFEIFVWLLWSIKESAFKFLQRIKPELLFTPVKFEVSALQIPPRFTLLNFNAIELHGIGFNGLNVIESTIKYEDHILYSKSLIYHELINTVVSDTNNFSKTHWGIKKIDSNKTDIQSTEVRSFLINNLTDKDIILGKNIKGIPVLLKDNVELPIPVSFSHHEYYVAYSFQLSV